MNACKFRRRRGTEIQNIEERCKQPLIGFGWVRPQAARRSLANNGTQERSWKNIR